MIQHLPNWINLLFLATSVLTLLFFYFSNGKPKVLTALLVVWSVIQSILAYSGFYQNTDAFPPRFAFVLIPTTIFIVYGLLARQRKWIKKNRSTELSTFFHFVRLPVEIVLLQLFLHKMIPELMTFEGRNFDIIMGITAPIVGVLYVKGFLSKKLLLIWNAIGLFFIFFILVNGILSAELPFQQFAFDQPNRGINYFPFILLPALIVPLVIWTHLSDIVNLRKETKRNKYRS